MDEKNTSLVLYNNSIRRFFNKIWNRIRSIFKDPNAASFSQGNKIPENVLNVIKSEFATEIATIDFSKEVEKAPEEVTIITEEKEPEVQDNPKTPKKDGLDLQKLKKSIEKNNEVDLDSNN